MTFHMVVDCEHVDVINHLNQLILQQPIHVDVHLIQVLRFLMGVIHLRLI